MKRKLKSKPTPEGRAVAYQIAESCNSKQIKDGRPVLVAWGEWRASREPFRNSARPQ
jgi:hypothetical protein